MDTIEFRVGPTPHWYGDGVDIHINGTPLTDLVRAVELPFAQAEGHSNIAGAYSGLAASAHLPPARHFWGESEWREDGKVDVLVCGDCGEGGCWPLLARIAVDPERVVWSDFEQPHRNDPEETAAWKYDGLGPFVFGREQYEEALHRAAAEAQRA